MAAPAPTPTVPAGHRSGPESAQAPPWARRIRHAARRWALTAATAAALGLAGWAGLSAAAGVADALDRDRFAAAIAQVAGSPARGERLAQEWVQGLTEAAALDDTQKLDRINRLANRLIVFSEDQATWGVEDYWASPAESLGRGAGDCEDFAIAKYYALRAAGVGADQLRLVYVRAAIPVDGTVRSLAHMVLAYYGPRANDPLILDNLVPDVRNASRRPDLTPVFSFNAEGLWQGAGQQTAGDPMKRLSRWRDVLAKARQEGWR